MAKQNEVSKALEKAPEARPVQNTLKSLVNLPAVKQKFTEMLGEKKAAGFLSSIISATETNSALLKCEPMSVVASAAVAASLDLPINPSLGFAYIVPYSNKAQFQMGWKGYVQLGMRSGQYERMNCSEVYQDELEFYNPITGDIKFREQGEWKQRYGNERDKIVGYVAYFKLLNGFVSYLYMTKSQVESHGKEYSKSYHLDNGNWKKRFDAMAKKTVMKLLLSKFGILSIEMQKAIQVDQAVVNADNSLEYVDSASMTGIFADPGVDAVEAQSADPAAAFADIVSDTNANESRT